MAACHVCTRILAMVWRTLERTRELTGQISVARALLATRFSQRGCVNQIISARGNDWRRPATAGKVWTMSPREPRRTMRKRGSDMRGLADGIEKRAGGMVFGIAYDGDADAEAGGDGAFGDGVGGVVSAFGVDVGAQFFEEFFDVGFGKNHGVIHGAESGYEKSAGLFVEDGAAGAFQRADAGIGIDGDDEKIAFGFGGGEIASVADVERVEDAVGEDNALAALLCGGQQGD
jgi:hypothetical protein